MSLQSYTSWSLIRHLQRFPPVLMAAILIPINSSSGWIQDSYSKIPKNEVIFSSEGLLIKVDKSASPLFYALVPGKTVVGFRVAGQFRGLPNFGSSDAKDSKGKDDCGLRIGFVVPGKNRLSRFQRLFAPAWVKNLYATIPSDAGVEGVRFFSLTQTNQLLGKSRIHPSSSLITEDFFALAENDGPFEYFYNLETPIEAAAIWISIDGDDTKSKFDVLLKKLEVQVK